MRVRIGEGETQMGARGDEGKAQVRVKGVGVKYECSTTTKRQLITQKTVRYLKSK